jgi:hypothetical protein
MANANIQRLLTDFGKQSKGDQAGSSFGSRMAAAGRGFGQGMITSLGRAGAQSGIKAFENMDMRPAAEKLNERLGQIDRTTPEGQRELIQIVAGTQGTGAAVQLQQQFDAQNKALAEEKARKEALRKQRAALVSSATALKLKSTVESLQSGGSLEEAQKTIYEEQQRNMVNRGGRRGKAAVAKTKNASPELIANINNGMYDEMSDALFLKELEGKKATIKAFTNAQGEVQSRRVDESANVWNPETSRWESPMDLGLRPAPVVTKQISAADGITSKLTGKMTDNFLELNAQAQTAEKILRINRDSMEVLDKGIVSGFTAPIQLEVMRIGKAMGILPEDMEDKVAATELFMISRAKQVLPLIKALGSGTAISDKDREFIEKVVGGNIALDERTIREVIRIESQVAMDAINANNSALDTLNRVEGTELDNSVYQSLYIQPPEMTTTQQGYSSGAQSYLNRIK